MAKAKKQEEKKPSIMDMLKKQKASTVQQTIPYELFYQNGMVLNAPGEYSRMYSFDDTNFDTETEDKQESIMEDFKKILNKFSHNVSVQYNVINEKISKKELDNAFNIKPKPADVIRSGDPEEEIARKTSIQTYREEYNAIVAERIEEGRNDIKKTRYITLNIIAPDILIANKTFINLENELNEAFKRINKEGVKMLNVEQRLTVLFKIFNSGSATDFSKICEKYHNADGELDLELLHKKGMTTKDLIAPSHMINGTDKVALGKQLVARSFLITDLPTEMESNFMSEISNVPTAMIVSIIHKTKPKSKALREIKIHNNAIKGDVIKANKQAYKENYDPSLMSESLSEAREEGRFLVEDMTVNNQKAFYTTATVTLLSDDLELLESDTEVLQMKAEDFSCQLKELNGLQMLGFKTTLPFASKYLPIDRLLTTEGACAFFPFSIQELMDANGHFYGLNALTRNMIMYNRRTSALPNGLIFGKAGSGKSFITKGEIIPILLDYEDDVIILDPDGEYVPIAHEFGGTVIEMNTKSEIHINPLDLDMEYPDPKNPRKGDKDSDPVAAKINFIVSLVEAAMGNSDIVSTYDITVIQRCARRMYKAYIQHMDDMYEEAKRTGSDIITIDTEACPTLLNLYEEFANDGSQEGQRLAMVIEPFCLGEYKIFSHKTNIEGTPRFLVYDLRGLVNKQLKNFVMKICLSDIWNRACKNKDAKKATWVYLDEFYLLAQTESARQTLQEYFKRIRKYFGIMTGITQDAEDLIKDSEGRGMFNNTGFVLMMNQSQDGRMILQDQLGISESLLTYIKDQPPGNGLLYNGKSIIPFDYHIGANTKLYKLMSTKPGE